MWNIFSSDDENRFSQARDARYLFGQLPPGSYPKLTSLDQLPAAHGEFGFSSSNPIPVNGPIGETVYIFRLCGKMGAPFFYQRLGSVNSDFGFPIDAYEILSTDGKEWHILYFSMYHIRRSKKCPEGMQFRKWGDIKRLVSLAKEGVFGTRFGYSDQFPFCLIECIEKNKNLARLGKDTPAMAVRIVSEMLQGINISPRPYDLKELGFLENCVESDISNHPAAILASIAAKVADGLSDTEKSRFLQASELPQTSWTKSHAEMFVLGYIEFFKMAKAGKITAPDLVLNIARNIEDDAAGLGHDLSPALVELYREHIYSAPNEHKY